MSRLPLTDPGDLAGARLQQWNRFPSNLTRALLLLDDRLAGCLPSTANALRTADLNPAWREAVILRVAALQKSAYERFQHLDQARTHGWTPEQIDAIEGGDYTTLPPDLAAVLRFADAVVTSPSVPDAVFADAHRALSDRQLVTVIVLVGHYMTVARVLGVLEVDLDAAPDDWTHEH